MKMTLILAIAVWVAVFAFFLWLLYSAGKGGNDRRDQ